MHVLDDEPRIVVPLHYLVQLSIYIQILQVIFPIKRFANSLRGHPHLTGTYVERLQPVVGAILLNHKKPLQTHHDVNVGLNMAVVEHGARLSRFEIVGSRASRHDRYFAGDWHTIVAFSIGVQKRMIHSVEVQGMRHVVAVFQGNKYLIAPLHSNGR